MSDPGLGSKVAGDIAELGGEVLCALGHGFVPVGQPQDGTYSLGLLAVAHSSSPPPSGSFSSSCDCASLEPEELSLQEEKRACTQSRGCCVTGLINSFNIFENPMIVFFLFCAVPVCRVPACVANPCLCGDTLPVWRYPACKGVFQRHQVLFNTSAKCTPYPCLCGVTLPVWRAAFGLWLSGQYFPLLCECCSYGWLVNIFLFVDAVPVAVRSTLCPSL